MQIIELLQFMINPQKYIKSKKGLLRWSKLSRHIRRTKYKRCARCNSNKNLHVHHIHPKNMYPYLAFRKTNLITLCSKCHTLADDSYHALNGNKCINCRDTFLNWLSSTMCDNGCFK